MKVAILWLVCTMVSRGEVLVLGKGGKRDPVAFDHAAHEKAVPNPASPFRATLKNTCIGCHHARTGRGAPQLAPCASCHRAESASGNPAAKAGAGEMHREAAFHSNCISCHEVSKKGPVACNGCHRPQPPAPPAGER